MGGVMDISLTIGSLTPFQRRSTKDINVERSFDAFTTWACRVLVEVSPGATVRILCQECGSNWGIEIDGERKPANDGNIEKVWIILEALAREDDWIVKARADEPPLPMKLRLPWEPKVPVDET